VDTLNGTILYENTFEQFFALEGAHPLIRLTPREVQLSWGSLQTNRSIAGNTLTLAGVQYNEGIGAHAYTRLGYGLEGKYKRFTALVGLDDEEMCSDGIRVRISADGKQLLETGDLHPGKPQTIDVSLQDAQTLLIEADSLGNKNCDHFDIVQATLYPAR